MIFGILDLFAIETEVDEVCQNRVLGRLRFYIGALSVGDFEDISDLTASARWGRVFLKASPRRTRPDLEHKTAQEILKLLHDRYLISVCDIQDSGLAFQSDLAMPNWDRDPYLLDDVGDAALLDKYTMIAVRIRNHTDRLIVRKFNEDKDDVIQITVGSGLVDNVITQYCTWVEALTKNRA